MLGVGTVAEKCHVTPDTIRRWVKAGHLKPTFVTPGGHRKFTEEDVEAFLRERSGKQALPPLTECPSCGCDERTPWDEPDCECTDPECNCAP